MNFCNRTLLNLAFEFENSDGIEIRTYLYKIFVPILLIGCLLSWLMNAILVAVGSLSRSKVRSRSPILVLSLNLAVTDALASFFMGIGLFINSFLPVVLNVNIGSASCIMLLFEILRMSAFIASAMHLLALALVHYKGIINPLHYRSVIFCSQHRTRSIHLMTFVCWLVPATFFALYFASIPCQGFQTENCDAQFILTLQYRSIVMIAFFIPLIFMSILYIRIFVIIKHHQAQRAIQRQQSCQLSARHLTKSPYIQSHVKSTPASSKRAQLLTSQNLMETIDSNVNQNRKQSKSKIILSAYFSNSCENIASRCNAEKDDYVKEVDDKIDDEKVNQNSNMKNGLQNNNSSSTPIKRRQFQRQMQFNSMTVATGTPQKPNLVAKTMLCRGDASCDEFDNDVQNTKRTVDWIAMSFLPTSCCKASSSSSLPSSPASSSSQRNDLQNASLTFSRSSPSLVDENVGGEQRRQKYTRECNSMSTTPRHSHTINEIDKSRIHGGGDQDKRRWRLSHNPSTTTTTSVTYEHNASGGHTKALVTTLLILGTYLLCYMPAVIYFALTCVDRCPFPITNLSFRWRISLSFATNGLVLLKALVDPFIYTYRMKEMKSALNRCCAFVCPSAAALICPSQSEHTTNSQRHPSKHDSCNRTSVSLRKSGQSSLHVINSTTRHENKWTAKKLDRCSTQTISQAG